MAHLPAPPVHTVVVASAGAAPWELPKKEESGTVLQCLSNKMPRCKKTFAAVTGSQRFQVVTVSQLITPVVVSVREKVAMVLLQQKAATVPSSGQGKDMDMEAWESCVN